MGDGNSWCTCTRKLPQGFDKSGCPVHDRHDKRDTLHYEVPEIEVETITDDRGRTTGWIGKTINDEPITKSDIAEAINSMAEEAFTTSKEKGFHDSDIDNTDAMTLARVALVHTELSEFVDELRKPSPDEYELALELADVLIRVGDLAHHMELDLGEAVVTKMEKNKSREYKHGKRI